MLGVDFEEAKIEEGEEERKWSECGDYISSQNRSHNRSPLLMIIINHKFMNCYFFSAIVSFLSINNWN